MSCKDRTDELKSIIRTQAERQNVAVKKLAKNPERAQRSEFNRMAKVIQTDINSTFTKLEKLALLAKKKTMFDDRPIEIQELTYIVKQDIGALNQQIARLKDYQENGKGRGGGEKQRQAHSSSIVLSLQSSLASMSTSFKDTLELRTKNLQDQKSRQQVFSSRDNQTASLIQPANSDSILYRLDHEATYRPHHPAMDEDEPTSVAIDMAMPSDPIAYQQMQIMEQNNSYIQDRSVAVEQINKTITELGSIFTQLATMVHEQGQQVQ
eukprot:Ihof_evm15s139 gene=Ihof_evmTU15s139